MSNTVIYILVAVAVVLILAGIVGTMTRQAKGTKRLRSALGDADPKVRRAAIEVIAERGIGDYADQLHPMITAEQDPEVLGALVAAIAKNQWEPADNRKLVDLRLWATAQNAAKAEAAAASAEPEAPSPVAAPAMASADTVTAVVAPPVPAEPVAPAKPSEADRLLALARAECDRMLLEARVECDRMLARSRHDADEQLAAAAVAHANVLDQARRDAAAIVEEANAERVRQLEATFAECAAMVELIRSGQEQLLGDARSMVATALAPTAGVLLEPSSTDAASDADDRALVGAGIATSTSNGKGSHAGGGTEFALGQLIHFATEGTGDDSDPEVTGLVEAEPTPSVPEHKAPASLDFGDDPEDEEEDDDELDGAVEDDDLDDDDDDEDDEDEDGPQEIVVIVRTKKSKKSKKSKDKKKGSSKKSSKAPKGRDDAKGSKKGSSKKKK